MEGTGSSNLVEEVLPFSLDKPFAILRMRVFKWMRIFKWKKPLHHR
jgi:hypothetical protein